VALVLVLLKGAWMHDVGFSRLGAIAATGLDLFADAPMAAVAALVLVVFILAGDASIPE
jgi:hypothetical protein